MIERGNIRIHGDRAPVDANAEAWSAERYERAVASILDRIRSSRVGAVVLRHVRGPVRIVPFTHRHSPGAFTSCPPA